MIPIIVTVQFDTADADGISTSQTPGAAGALTITGALASGGVATLCDDGMARQVLFTCAGNETGKTFTVTGTNATGNPISTTVAGPNATTATTSIYFRTVTEVTISAAAAGAITVGTNQQGATRPVSLDMNKRPFEVTYACDITGTVNYDVEHTLDDLNDPSVTAPYWFNDANLVNESSDQFGNIAFPVRFSRVVVNTGTGTVRAAILQAG